MWKFSSSDERSTFQKGRLSRVGGRKGRVSGRIYYANRDTRTVAMIKTLVPSGNKQPYIVGVGWDMTDIKKTEKELIDARVKAEEADKSEIFFSLPI